MKISASSLGTILTIRIGPARDWSVVTSCAFPNPQDATEAEKMINELAKAQTIAATAPTGDPGLSAIISKLVDNTHSQQCEHISDLRLMLTRPISVVDAPVPVGLRP